VNMTGRTVAVKYKVNPKLSADIVLDWIEKGCALSLLYYEEPDETGHK